MTLVIIALGLLPSFAWLIFFLKEDPHPEPRRLIFFTFLAGAGVTLVAFAAQVILNAGFDLISLSQRSAIALFGLAAIEEIFKFGAVYFVVSRSRAFDEPVDAMIYLIVAALGFTAVENIGALDTATDTLRRESYGGALISGAAETTMLRFIGATLLHTLSSGIVGYYWAKGILQKSVTRSLAAGILIATALHAFFNYLILRYEEIILATLFLVVVAFFVLNDFEKLQTKT